MPVQAEELTRLKAHRWQVSCLEFDRDGSRLASGGWDKEVHIWDLSSLEIAHTLKGTRSPVTCLSWYRPNSGILCTGSADQTASLWNTETGCRVATLTEHFGWVLGSCFSASGSLLATASWDKTIRIWDAGTATLINNLNGHTAGVWSVDFHPSSPTLCSAGHDGSVMIWDARSNRPVRNLSYGHTDAVYCAKWSPDGALIASGSADTKICVWEPSKGSVINTIYGHTDTVKSVAFNPNLDANFALPILASAGDFSVHLSDPRPTQKANVLSFSLHHPGKEVEAVSISPDGSLLVSGGRDGLLVLMNLTIPTVVPRTGNRATTSTSVRHSCEILEQSRVQDTSSDSLIVIPERPEENLKVVYEPFETALAAKREERRLSQYNEKKSRPSVTSKKVSLRRAASREAQEKRMKEKVVDIPSMVRHLSARASFVEESGSSSGSESSSSSESEDGSGSDDLERQYLVKVSERAGRFMKRKNTVQEIMESTERSPPSPKLSLLPEEAVGRLKEHRSTFEKKKKEKTKSAFHGEEMDSVVLLMKNFLDDNKPSEDTAGQGHGEVNEQTIDLYDSGSASSLDERSGHLSISPERINSSLDFSQTSNPSPEKDKNHPLYRISSASGNEYGDEVPLSMI